MTRTYWLPSKHIDKLSQLPRFWDTEIEDPIDGKKEITVIDGHMGDISKTIERIRAFRKKLIKSGNDRLFEIVKTKNNRYSIEAKSTVATELERLYSSFSQIEKWVQRTHILAPYGRVFADTQRRIPIRWPDVKKPHLSEEEAQTHLNRLTRIINILTKRFKNPNVIRMESNFRRGPMQNFTSTLEFLDACAKMRSNVLMLRIDLQYERSKCPITQIRDHSNRPVEYFDYDEIMRHRERLTAEINKIYGNGLVGYVIKFELGYERGPHFHCLFILDAALHHKKDFHDYQIAGIWKDVTAGNGTYYCCKEDKYRWKIVGRRDMLDENTRIGLVFFAGYICTTETLLKPRVPSHHRLLTKGCITAPSAPNKVGRPPKARHADSLMNLDISERLKANLSPALKSHEAS
ncbi:MAG: hypothetical protein EKK47_13965 [Burkholderiales bacterium]|nr:MAG: hypothetical protein EKK47_13965 [Burkholderiales bacterium]